MSLPTNLTMQDRQTILETLGFGTIAKILGDPYPLGGYAGVEFGMTTEVMPTADIARLGARANQQSETSYSVFTFGKGLYNHIDMFLQFGLIGNSEDITNYGGQLRWSFYEAEYLPVFLTAILSGSSTNFQNLIIMNNQCLDLVSGINVDDVTLYLGVGKMRVQGTFVGGAQGLTDTGEIIKEGLEGTHYLAGLNLKFSRAFLALEIDRMAQSNYSAKIGFRF